jgi:MoaA/NifB/PqqE/SkfB family radical SAM enzyme
MEQSRKNRKWGLGQAALFIEPTNLCNLACIMCNHGDNSFERSLGVMKFKDFKKLADEIGAKKFNIWEVSPFWMGEPFIHPQITDFLSYLSAVRRIPGTIQHFNIHTNGNVLSKEHIDCIVESELDSILFSIDAAREDTYRKIRVNGELSVVIENIKKLMQARNKKAKRQPAIILQFILMDENSGEVPEFIKLGQELGINKVIFAGRKEDNKWDLPHDDNLLFPQIDFDLVFIKALEPNALTKEQSHREIITKIPQGMKRRPCGSLWRMFSVAWDGQATACCRDDQVKMPVGNVLEEGIENVWYGEKLKAIRLAHINGEFDKAPKCADCVNWVKYPMKDSEIIEWLESVGEDIIADNFKKGKL